MVHFDWRIVFEVFLESTGLFCKNKLCAKTESSILSDQNIMSVHYTNIEKDHVPKFMCLQFSTSAQFYRVSQLSFVLDCA